MSSYHFKIYFDQKQKDYIGDDEELLKEPLEKFANDNGKQLDDFQFYYKGSLISYENRLHIKDSIFSQNKGKKSNIIAISIVPPPISPTLSEEEKEVVEEKLERKEEKEKNEIQQIQPKEAPKDEKDEIPKEPIRRKVNKMYYNDVICPKCKTTAIIDKNEKDLNLRILNCENFHYLNNIKYDALDDFVFDFDDKSEENKKKLIKNKDVLECSICTTNQEYMTPPEYEDENLYACACGAIVCSLCSKIHAEKDERHHKVKLDDKNYYCLKHGQKYYSYCFDCNANICEKCEIDHIGHETEKYSTIKPKRETIKKYEEEVEKQQDQFLDFIETTRKLFDDIIDTIENYLNSYLMIESSLIRRYKMQQFNYQLLRNLKNKNLFENEIFNKLEEVTKKTKVSEKFNSLFKDIYTPIYNAKQMKDKQKRTIEMPFPNIKNSITIRYKIGEKKLDRKVKLFDPIFVENNKDKVTVVINGKEKELSAYYQNLEDKDEIIVTLSQKTTKTDRGDVVNREKYITDMSYMFNNCKYFDSVDFSKWKTENITSMEAMFQLCNFDKAPNISKFNISNLENIRAMFCKCIKLKDIPDMSRWPENSKDNHLSNMSMLFNGCKNLTNVTLPNNFKNMTKIEDISYMFNRCRNLEAVDNMKSLKKSNIKNMCGLFNGCEKLKSVTINLESRNIEDMSIMFQDCKSLGKLDNTFKDTKKVKDISGMFSGCSKLQKDIYTGITNTESVTNMVGVFNRCTILESLSDISKWSTNNVKNAKGIFYECKKFKQIPKGLNSWKFKNGTKYDEILEKCYLDNQERLKNDWKSNEPQELVRFN